MSAIVVGSGDLFCEKIYDAETNKLATASSTYIYFGVFPKTVLASDSSVTVDETKSIVMGANTYYAGSDGNYYAKVKENAYRDYSTYTDGTTAKQSSADSYRYFKVEPIKWKVLTTNYNNTGKVLLLAEDILTGNVPYHKDCYVERTLDGVTVYANNYKYSQIRAYLNGLDYYDSRWTGMNHIIVKKTDYIENGFLQTAFTMTAQESITETNVDNSVELTDDSVDIYVCENTNDKVFLLSESEVLNSNYGFLSPSKRERHATDYAIATYVVFNGGHSKYDNGDAWFLRSPGFKKEYVRSVTWIGETTYDYTEKESMGVVPALCISLE